MNFKSSLTTLLRDGFILVFNQNKLDVVKTAQSLIDAGIHNMEVTCRINEPLKNIVRLKKELPDFCCGAASLVDFDGFLNTYNSINSKDPIPTVDQAVNAGVDYLVSAVNFSDNSYTKYAHKLPMIPGTATATEIASQFSKGANLCKLFPANIVGGASYIKSIDPAIHKMISIVPTGGTISQNIPDYAATGVLVFGGSFSMFNKDNFNKILTNQDYKLLTEELILIKSQIDECRAKAYPFLNFKTATIEEIQQATGRNFNID